MNQFRDFRFISFSFVWHFQVDRLEKEVQQLRSQMERKSSTISIEDDDDDDDDDGTKWNIFICEL